MNSNTKVFISHNHTDVFYAEILIDIFKKIGVSSSNIYCSSVDGYGTSLRETF
jgi:hypothetical protein